MKPNPISKTVEYCRLSSRLKCEYYRREDYHHWCMKHKKTIEETENYECVRPAWCTDETFVRVKIEPVNIGDEQYCWYNMAKCSHYYFGGKDDLCTIMNKRLLWDTNIGESRKKRPEACRKLEVE